MQFWLRPIFNKKAWPGVDLSIRKTGMFTEKARIRYLDWPLLLTNRHVPGLASMYHSLISYPGLVLLIRRFSGCDDDISVMDERNWRNCKTFQDEVFAKDTSGNPLGPILMVGGSILKENDGESDKSNIEAYKNYLEVERVSVLFDIKDSW